METSAQFAGVVSELDSLVSGSPQGKVPDALLTFDTLTKLLSCLKEQDKDSVAKVQRQCEDRLEALLLLGLRPPNRRLASQAMVELISKGENISIYSRANGIQGWLSDFVDKKKDPAAYIGAAQCLGALMRIFGQKLTSSLQEIASIVAKLMKHPEVSVRQAALQLLQDAMEGTAGGGSATAHTEAVRVVTRIGAGDKAPAVRAAAACCLRAIAQAGGPGLHGSGLENAALGCVKGLEDSSQAVRDGYAAALGALVALGLNPQAQVQPKTKGTPAPGKALEGAVQKYLVAPFTKASGPHARETKMGLALAWVSFLQSMHSTYGLLDTDLISYGMQAIEMLKPGGKGAVLVDPQAQACVIYIVRVGIVEQMGEVAQRELTNQLIKQLPAAEVCAPVLIVMLRTLAHLLDVLGEVSLSTREALDATLTAILNNPSAAVRVETALTIRALALVDPGCVNGMMYCGVTLMKALRESVAGARGDHLKGDLDSLHGQAVMLAALLVAAPRLPLGVPSRLAEQIFEVAQEMVLQPVRNPVATNGERSVGWMLIAALVASMTKDELEEHAVGLLALWAIPFGGNCAEKVKKVEPGLQSEVGTWVAAMDALGAFIRHCICPLLNRSAPNSSTLLQTVLGYLSGALQYLSSNVLQEASSLRAGMEQLTIRTLDAYRALPDANLYKIDHVPLLSICTLPFRDAANTAPNSCLRQLLNPADACLGPWMPGRDSFEDELRAFEGGSDGLLPCVWSSETPAFPQPLPQAVLVVDSMLLCFGVVFATQSEAKKNYLLELVLTSLKGGRKQPWKAANAANICVALLGGLKAASGRGKEVAEPETWKKVESVIQGVLQADATSSILRRGAGEALGLLAKLADDAFRVRLTRSLISELGASGEALHKAGMAFALGCIHRSVGGMALQTLVPGTVQALTNLAKDATDGLHIWALHGLWLTADAAGLAFFPHVQATLSTCMDLLLSEDHCAPELQPAVGRLVNAMVAVLGPELSAGSRVFSRCQSIVADMSTAEEPSAQLECVLYAQQLVLFAPQAVPAHNHVATLRATLSSRQPSLRDAAVATLRHLSERDPLSIIPERIEEDLFAMLDSETDPKIMQGVRLTLERLLEAACPSCPSRWLGLCKNVVLAASTTKSAGTQPGSPTSGLASPRAGKSADDGGLGENDEEGFGVSGTKEIPQGVTAKEGPKAGSSDQDHLPRYRTRVFAAECLERLPTAVGTERGHFDLEAAQEKSSNDWLVLHLSELVGIAFQMVTGPLEMLRPMGVTLLNVILEKFGATADPHFEGHLLLEQYQAQLVSALRAAFEPGAGPLLIAAGAKLAAGVITTEVAAGDRGVLQRVLGMLVNPLSKWDALSLPSYAEWVGSTVKISLLEAHARVKCFAAANESTAVNEDATPGTPVADVLKGLIRPHGQKLSRCWVGLLRDYAAGKLLATAVLGKYQPFLQDSHSAAALSAVRPYLEGAWVKVLEAVTIGVSPAENKEGYSKKSIDRNGFKSSDWGNVIDSKEFDQLWGIAVAVLTEGALPANGLTEGRASAQPGELRRVALRGLKSLSAPAFCTHDMLSTDLCRELLQALAALAAPEKVSLQQPILELLEELVSSTPEDYIAVDSLLRDSAAELGLSELRLLLTEASAKPICDASLQAAYRALFALAKRAGSDGQATLVPQLLAEGLKALESVSVLGGALSASGKFLGDIATVKGAENRGQVLGGLVESLSQVAEKQVAILQENGGLQRRPSTSFFENEDGSPTSDAEARLPVVLSVLGSVTKEISNEESRQAVHRSLAVVRSCLASPSTAVQTIGLQSIRNALQATAGGDSLESLWARQVARELTQDVCAIVRSATSALTSASANVMGDCLKVLVLLHTIAEGASAQEEALRILLATIIAAATPPPEGHNAASLGLASLAVKLVTHLATVPTTAAQFKSVVASLPPGTKLQLQSVLRASAGQPANAPQEQATKVAPPPKLVVPLPLKGFAPPPSASTGIRVAVPQKAPKQELEKEMNDDWSDEEEGWGEAKAATSAEEGAPKEATAATSVEEGAPQNDASAEAGKENGQAQQLDEFDEDDWGDEFESAPPAADVSKPADGEEADVSNDLDADVSKDSDADASKGSDADVSRAGAVNGTVGEEDGGEKDEEKHGEKATKEEALNVLVAEGTSSLLKDTQALPESGDSSAESQDAARVLEEELGQSSAVEQGEIQREAVVLSGGQEASLSTEQSKKAEIVEDLHEHVGYSNGSLEESDVSTRQESATAEACAVLEENSQRVAETESSLNINDLEAAGSGQEASAEMEPVGRTLAEGIVNEATPETELLGPQKAPTVEAHEPSQSSGEASSQMQPVGALVAESTTAGFPPETELLTAEKATALGSHEQGGRAHSSGEASSEMEPVGALVAESIMDGSTPETELLTAEKATALGSHEQAGKSYISGKALSEMEPVGALVAESTMDGSTPETELLTAEKATALGSHEQAGKSYITGKALSEMEPVGALVAESIMDGATPETELLASEDTTDESARDSQSGVDSVAMMEPVGRVAAETILENAAPEAMSLLPESGSNREAPKSARSSQSGVENAADMIEPVGGILAESIIGEAKSESDPLVPEADSFGPSAPVRSTSDKDVASTPSEDQVEVEKLDITEAKG